ncbi:hypothetical protein GCM10009634_45300 [Saccharothrix xinjiangensis]
MVFAAVVTAGRGVESSAKPLGAAQLAAAAAAAANKAVSRRERARIIAPITHLCAKCCNCLQGKLAATD